MTLDELIEKLEELRIDGDTGVYMQMGLYQTPVDNVECYEETDYEFAAVVLS